jgi:hypothetical protein
VDREDGEETAVEEQRRSPQTIRRTPAAVGYFVVPRDHLLT